jgi:hypothetical protein
MPEEAFFDAYHLRPDRARELTRYVGRQTTILTTGSNKGRRFSPAAGTRPPSGGSQTLHAD